MGSTEGLSPFARSLRVSLRYKLLAFLTRKGATGMIERVLSALLEPWQPSEAEAGAVIGRLTS